MLNELCKLSELDDEEKHKESGQQEEGVDPETVVIIKRKGYSNQRVTVFVKFV